MKSSSQLLMESCYIESRNVWYVCVVCILLLYMLMYTGGVVVAFNDFVYFNFCAQLAIMEVIVAVLFCVLSLSAAQGCPLPNNTEIETAMRGLPTAGDGSQALNPTITGSIQYVCLAQGNMINTYRFLSVIATYTPSPGVSTRTNIFQLICSNGVWTADTSGQPEAPDPSVRNVTRTDCVQCRHNYGVTRCRRKPTCKISHC